jgi:DNA-binding MarR family transcriptional regulator
MSQLGALMHIHQEGCTGVSNLGDRLGVSSAAASQLLERLVQQDLVFRTEDSEDRRVKQLILTDKGKQLLHESLNARLGWIDEFSASLSASEKEQLAASFNILIEKLLLFEPPAVSKN